MIKKQKRTPIYQPGFWGKFYYYFLEILNLWALLFFNCCFIAIAVFYFWSMVDAHSVPAYVFDSSDKVWSWSYQLKNIVCLLFLYLCLSNMRIVFIDFFSRKLTKTIRITDKMTQTVSPSQHKGYKGYFIGEGKEYFEITEKAYDKLDIGDTVKLLYTQKQKNVRRIEKVNYYQKRK